MPIQNQDFPVGVLRLNLGDRTGDGSGGPAIHVYGPHVSGSERQLLRFDCFKIEPHYHYDPYGIDDKIDLEGEDGADSVAWSLIQLRTRMPEMVKRAGGTPEAVSAAGTEAAQTAVSLLATVLGR